MNQACLHGRSLASLLLPIALLTTWILDTEDVVQLKPTNLYINNAITQSHDYIADANEKGKIHVYTPYTSFMLAKIITRAADQPLLLDRIQPILYL